MAQFMPGEHSATPGKPHFRAIGFSLKLIRNPEPLQRRPVRFAGRRVNSAVMCRLSVYNFHFNVILYSKSLIPSFIAFLLFIKTIIGINFLAFLFSLVFFFISSLISSSFTPAIVFSVK